jgi:hypothetical protein
LAACSTVACRSAIAATSARLPSVLPSSTMTISWSSPRKSAPSTAFTISSSVLASL